MKRDRLIVDIESMEQARRVEETVKSGYSGTIIENLLQWIAVEEDLASSYEALSRTLGGDDKKVAEALCRESRDNISRLATVLKEVEALDAARSRRIEVISGSLRGGRQ